MGNLGIRFEVLFSGKGDLTSNFVSFVSKISLGLDLSLTEVTLLCGYY